MSSKIPNEVLNNGAKIPMLGFSSWGWGVSESLILHISWKFASFQIFGRFLFFFWKIFFLWKIVMAKKIEVKSRDYFLKRGPGPQRSEMWRKYFHLVSFCAITGNWKRNNWASCKRCNWSRIQIYRHSSDQRQWRRSGQRNFRKDRARCSEKVNGQFAFFVKCRLFLKAKKCVPFSREELYIVGKLWNPKAFHDPALIKGELMSTLRNLNLTYLDLYVIQCPEGEVQNVNDTWHEMEKLIDNFIVKSIGVSNFNEEQISYLLTSARCS